MADLGWIDRRPHEHEIADDEWFPSKIDRSAHGGLHPALVNQRHADLLVGSDNKPRAIKCVGSGGEELVWLAHLCAEIRDQCVGVCRRVWRSPAVERVRTLTMSVQRSASSPAALAEPDPGVSRC